MGKITIEIFNDWTISSKDIKFYLLSNQDKVAIKMADAENGELFYGTITTDAVRIYELNTYSCDIEINYANRTIHFIQIEGQD